VAESESIELEKCSIELWIGLGTNLRPIVRDLAVLSRLCFFGVKDVRLVEQE
jgi:hypothetical protein